MENLGILIQQIQLSSQDTRALLRTWLDNSTKNNYAELSGWGIKPDALATAQADFRTFHCACILRCTGVISAGELDTVEAELLVLSKPV